MFPLLPDVTHDDEAQCQVSQPELSMASQVVRTQIGHLLAKVEQCVIFSTYFYEVLAESHFIVLMVLQKSTASHFMDQVSQLMCVDEVCEVAGQVNPNIVVFWQVSLNEA